MLSSAGQRRYALTGTSFLGETDSTGSSLLGDNESAGKTRIPFLSAPDDTDGDDMGICNLVLLLFLLLLLFCHDLFLY